MKNLEKEFIVKRDLTDFLTIVLLGDRLNSLFKPFFSALIVLFVLSLVVRILVHLRVTRVVVLGWLLEASSSRNLLVDCACSVGTVASRAVSRRRVSTTLLFINLFFFVTRVSAASVHVVRVHLVVVALFGFLHILRSSMIPKFSLGGPGDLVLHVSFEFPMTLRKVTFFHVSNSLEVLLLSGVVARFLDAF